MKILLVQVRNEQEMADHESKIVARTMGIDESVFTRVNVRKDERVDLSTLEQYDAVMIGGSGGSSVIDETDYNDHLMEIVRAVKEKDMPFLGLCYGFQIAVKALGGTMIKDMPSMETGSFLATRTLESDSDPLIGSLPRQFEVACGRQDRATSLPEGAVNYMSTEKCPYHFMTFPGTNFYGAQFHPELWKKEDNLIRITFYQKKYGLSGEEFEKQLKQFWDVPVGAAILKNFANLVKEKTA